MYGAQLKLRPDKKIELNGNHAISESKKGIQAHFRLTLQYKLNPQVWSWLSARHTLGLFKGRTSRCTAANRILELEQTAVLAVLTVSKHRR